MFIISIGTFIEEVYQKFGEWFEPLIRPVRPQTRHLSHLSHRDASSSGC